jgi:YfiH family protein
MPTEHLVYPPLFPPEITAFFTGRVPGTDKTEIARIAGIPPENIFYPVQKHTNRVIILEEGSIIILEEGSGDPLSSRRGISDAVITARAGVLIGVQTADCVPILLYDGETGAIGAVHAGWRGTAKGILKNSIKEMNRKFGSILGNIKLAIGPAIRACHYEVGEDVLLEVKEQTGEGNYYKLGEGKPRLDLPLANRQQALSIGIPGENIWLSADCTYCEGDVYFSYRREKTRPALIDNEIGRQGGFIVKRR